VAIVACPAEGHLGEGAEVPDPEAALVRAPVIHQEGRLGESDLSRDLLHPRVVQPRRIEYHAGRVTALAVAIEGGVPQNGGSLADMCLLCGVVHG
jgi:hypothetical protein